ncbi:MAG: hypothetical protein GX547_16225 [Phycisphaerae bacterium]|nr:hypothetical protein [Phycisphaerae bacterium]
MSFCVGLDAVLKYGAVNTTPATTLQNVQDVTVSGDKETIDRVRRGVKWKGKKTTCKNLALDVALLYDPTDAGFTAIRQAYYNDTPIALAALDDQGHGWIADYEVTKFERSEPVEGDLTMSLSFALNTDKRSPVWV